MKQHTKLTQHEYSGQEAEQHAAQQTHPHEFASVEEVLRHDAARTDVPPGLTRRIQEAAATVPVPKRAWWRQLFGR